MIPCPECGKTDQVTAAPMLVGSVDESGATGCVDGGVCRRCGIWFLPWGEFGDLEEDDFDEAE